MPFAHIHLGYGRIEGDSDEALRITDDLTDAVTRQITNESLVLPRYLVTAMFYDLYTDNPLGEYIEDENEPSPPANDTEGRLEGVRRWIRQLTGTSADAAGKVAETVAGQAGSVAKGAKTRVENLGGAAASQIGQVVGDTFVRFSKFAAALNKATTKQMRRIDRNTKGLRDDLIEWGKATGAAVGAAFLRVENMVPSFGDLPPVVKAKFAMAGLRGAWRPVEFAQGFFEEGIPAVVRNLGESAVLKFVEGKHAGHIKAVANAPEKMMEHANIVWERAKDNLARGAADMNTMELAKANAINAMDAAGIVAGQAIKTAATAGCIGMALEGVVTVAENYIYVYRGEKDVDEAVKDAARDAINKGVASAIGGIGLTVALSFGAGPAIAAAGPVIVTVGGATFVLTAYKRIKTALDSTEPEHHDSGSLPGFRFNVITQPLNKGAAPKSSPLLETRTLFIGVRAVKLGD
ncbi:MAG: hypothetical protein OXG89_05640 [bacterium]|nr:hypothetical protein [bacterium]